jgi:hypothetical protein
MAHSTSRTNQRPPTTLGRVEPVQIAEARDRQLWRVPYLVRWRRRMPHGDV